MGDDRAAQSSRGTRRSLRAGLRSTIASIVGDLNEHFLLRDPPLWFEELSADGLRRVAGCRRAPVSHHVCGHRTSALAGAGARAPHDPIVSGVTAPDGQSRRLRRAAFLDRDGVLNVDHGFCLATSGGGLRGRGKPSATQRRRLSHRGRHEPIWNRARLLHGAAVSRAPSLD